MSHSFPITFQPPLLRRVNFAIEPFDAFTGQAVRQPLQVWLTDRVDASERERLPLRIIVNGRGQYIVFGLPGGTRLFVHVRSRRTGYLDPDPVEVDVLPPPPESAQADDADVRVNRLIRIALYPAPDFPFHLWPETSLIRGRVVRTRQGREQAVARARVWIDPPPSSPPFALPFATLSDEVGSFALPVRLPPVLGADTPRPVPVTLHVLDDDRPGNPPAPLERQITVSIEDGRTHTLQPAINLSDTTPVRLASAQRGRVRVRGLIVRSPLGATPRPVVRGRISAELPSTPPPSGPLATALSDEFGRFSLSILLPAGQGTPTAPAQVSLRLRDDDRSGSPPRPVDRSLTLNAVEGGSYVAQSPIDLDGTAPVFFVND